MATYSIQFHANEGLYRSLRDEIEATRSNHRTLTGLFRGLIKAERHSDAFARSMGRYGGYSIYVDGKRIDRDLMQDIHMNMNEFRSVAPWDRSRVEGYVMDSLKML